MSSPQESGKPTQAQIDAVVNYLLEGAVPRYPVPLASQDQPRPAVPNPATAKSPDSEPNEPWMDELAKKLKFMGINCEPNYVGCLTAFCHDMVNGVVAYGLMGLLSSNNHKIVLVSGLATVEAMRLCSAVACGRIDKALRSAVELLPQLKGIRAVLKPFLGQLEQRIEAKPAAEVDNADLRVFKLARELQDRLPDCIWYLEHGIEAAEAAFRADPTVAQSMAAACP